MNKNCLPSKSKTVNLSFLDITHYILINFFFMFSLNIMELI